MRGRTRLGFSALLLALAIALPTLAYEYPLSSTAIRNAYFLGTEESNEGTEFVAQYTHSLSVPKTGPYISTVTIETPYLQVAERAGQTMGYDSQDAVKDFLNKPAQFRVRMVILFPPADLRTIAPEAGGLLFRSGDFWRYFKVKVMQNDKEIVPQSVQDWPLYPYEDEYSSGQSTGEQVQLDFEPEKIDASDLTIEIDKPNDQQVTTAFDLARLK